MIAAALILMIIVISLGADLWFAGLPWYTPMIIAFIAGIIAGRMKARAFLVGFLGVALFWTLLLLIIHFRNDGILTRRFSGLISDMLGFGISPAVLIIITVLIGGLIGGLSALSGKLISRPVDRSKRLSRMRKKRGGSYKLKI